MPDLSDVLTDAQIAAANAFAPGGNWTQPDRLRAIRELADGIEPRITAAEFADMQAVLDLDADGAPEVFDRMASAAKPAHALAEQFTATAARNPAEYLAAFVAERRWYRAEAVAAREILEEASHA